jgi:hypothetical protein
VRDRDDGEFLAFWLRDGAVVARMNVNVFDGTERVETLIRSRRAVDAAALSDPDTPLDLLAADGRAKLRGGPEMAPNPSSTAPRRRCLDLAGHPVAATAAEQRVR